jgi:hypothetical protein
MPWGVSPPDPWADPKHDRNLNIAVQIGFKANLRQRSQQRRIGLLPTWRRFEKEAVP